VTISSARELEFRSAVKSEPGAKLYRVVKIIRLTIDLMLAEPFPRIEKLTATIALKRQSSGSHNIFQIFFHHVYLF
jgi:hypothetical protein